MMRAIVRPLAQAPRRALGLRPLSSKAQIIYTETDEAPMLATYSLLPVFQAFAAKKGIDFTTSDISLSGRVIAQFSDKIRESQRIDDELAKLGELAKTPEALIIKLPNISASIPQLNECIAELRSKGYDVPLYPADPTTDEDKEVHARYAKVILTLILILTLNPKPYS
mmetsp:Transcript_30961/g.98364  ORF Transcript_30961/g.98364 Transcript_30961/m.98364 type:complete len:168 (-) Transcript_30961:19-522(-)